MGSVNVTFDINENGFAENIVIENLKGHSAYGKAMIDAIEKWRFIPKYENGKPVITKNVSNVFSFNVSKASRTGSHIRY